MVRSVSPLVITSSMLLRSGAETAFLDIYCTIETDLGLILFTLRCGQRKQKSGISGHPWGLSIL